MYDENISKKKTSTKKKRGRPRKTEATEEIVEIDTELADGYEANAELDQEVHEDFKYVDEEVVEEEEEHWESISFRKLKSTFEEKEEVKISEVKEIVDDREKVYSYYGTYIGPPGYLQLPGVGRIFPGREIELSKKIAQALGKSPKWRIRTSYEYK